MEGNDGYIIKDKEPAINKRNKAQLSSELSDEIHNMHGRMRVLAGQILSDIEQYSIKVFFTGSLPENKKEKYLLKKLNSSI